MKLRDNLSGIVSSVGKNNFTSTQQNQVGRVYGIVNTPNTPTQTQYERAGGINGMGSIFYLDYDQSKDIIGDSSDEFLNTCKIAKPLSPNDNYYPLINELVVIEDYPSAAAQLTDTSTQKYYSSVINIWNNQQHNAQPANDSADLGNSFTESSDIKPLLNFEGDHIILGRKGNSIRFGSTSHYYSELNEWSKTGTDGSPILIISNGHKPKLGFHIEKINEEDASFYLTSTQQLPLQPDRQDNLNPITQPVAVNLYSKPQAIINADRVVINSKVDEVMVFAKTNIEISTNNIINLNANDRVHLNGKRVFLGTTAPIDENSVAKLPTEPLLLGNQTVNILKDLCIALHSFAAVMNSNLTAPEGLPLDVGGASAGLMKDIQDITGRLSNILSKITFTA